MQKVHAYVQSKVKHIWEEEDEAALTKKGQEIYMGEASFPGIKGVLDLKDKQGVERRITFDKLILATGAEPRRVAEFQDIEAWDYIDVWNVETLPPRLMVVGGGPIGAELACAFAMLGSQVTVVASRGLVPRETQEAREMLEASFHELGIEVVRGKPDKAVQKGGEKVVTVGGKVCVRGMLLVSL